MPPKTRQLSPEAKEALEKIPIVQKNRTRLDVIEYGAMYDALAAGASWADIGAACGLTPRGVQVRYRKLSWAAEDNKMVADD